MILEIKRYPEYFDTTPGELWLDGERMAYTIERPWKNNVQRISCIPLGIYPVELTMSKRFNEMLPLLGNVPNRSGIRMHAANKAVELEGCIAPVTKLYIEGRTVFGSNSRSAVMDVFFWIRAHRIKEIHISKI